MRPANLLPLALLFLASPASAQSLRWTRSGAHSTQSYGRSVSSLADVDGDGYRDILVGDPLAEPAGSFFGQVQLLSGQNGAILYTISGATGTTRLGVDVLGIEDVDGDGIEDFVVTSDTEHPQVRSGIDGTWIRTLAIFSAPGDQVVESLGDIDGDGRRELIVGHQDFGTNHGQVLVVRGSFVATGAGPSLLWTRSGTQALGFLGAEVANAGDLDGDGFDDVVAGAPAATSPGQCGLVYMLDGTNGAVLHTLTLPSPCVGFGGELDGAGDWNGDGFADIVAGTSSDSTGGSSAGALRIYSGLTGGLLRTVLGSPNDRLGRSVLGRIDIDGDGRDEVLYGAHTDPCTTGRGTVRALDPATGAVQSTLCGAADGNLYGAELQAVGDVDGDGQDDFVVTDPEIVPTLAARVYLYGGDCTGYAAPFCDSTPNSSGASASILATGSFSVSTNAMALIARACPANKSGLFFYGKTPIMNPLGDGWRCAGGQTFRLMPIVQTNGAGIAQKSLDLTLAPLGSGPGAALAGSVFHFQYWFRDPGGGGSGFNLTDGVAVRFCP